jgi:DNA-binding NtrC family response regulator
LKAAESAEGVVAESPQMKQLLQELAVIAGGNLPVLFLGETGTGKDLLARLLHRWGPRQSAALVPLNAAQADGGLVDSELFGHKRGAFTGADSSRMGALLRAHNGTLFLDEVADLPLSTQVKLLRTLETGEIKPVGSDHCETSDFRLITATSRQLMPLLQAEKFRWDFYYRIAGAVVKIPPLRERREVIRGIAALFAKKHGLVITDSALERLSFFSWPGNARQLSNVLQLSWQKAKRSKKENIEADDIELPLENQPMAIIEPSAEACTLERMEKLWIEKTLLRTGGGRSQAAQELGIARSTLFEKMRRYQIHV